MRKSRLEFYLGTTTGTPAITAYNSGYQNRPEYMLTASDWDSPLNRQTISDDRPSGTGGSFADPFPTWPGFILSIEITALSKSAYRRFQLAQGLRNMTKTTGFVNIKRIQEFPDDGKQTVEWLMDCYFTDVDSMEYSSRDSIAFGFVFTSKNPSPADPVETSL